MSQLCAPSLIAGPAAMADASRDGLHPLQVLGLAARRRAARWPLHDIIITNIV